MHAPGSGQPAFDFTPAQQAVIDHLAGDLLVVAGPGTGKTRVVVERIARLIERRAAAPHEILALTFARRAAHEMHIRLWQRLGARAGPVTVGTFHSFCLNLIRRHYAALGYRSPPQVAGPRDQIELLRGVLAAMNQATLGPLAPIAGRPLGAGLIAEAIGRIAEAPADAFDAPVRHALEGVAAAYRNAVRTRGLVDQASMVPEVVALCERDDALLAELRERYRFVIADEYQDTNRPQNRLLELLAPPGSNLMVVGDDDQAIYAFRGTSPRNLIDFQAQRSPTRLELSENWRCRSEIQSAAGALVAHNEHRLAKDVRSVHEGGEVEALHFADPAAHAHGLATLIEDEVRLGGRRCGEIAVLWRSLTNPLVPLLAGELKRLGIPARVMRPEPGGGGIREAVAAILRMRRTGGAVSDEGLVTVLESELCGTPLAHAQRLAREAARDRAPLAAFVARQIDDRHARQCAATLAHVRKVLATSSEQPAEFLFEVWRTFPSLAEAARRISDPDVDEQTRARRVVAQFRSLFEDAEAFRLANPDAPPGGFLERLELGSDEPRDPPFDDPGDDVVRFMTAHQAKGLEWPVVLIPALEDGSFPIAGGDRGPAGMAGALTRPSSPAGVVEEERRLFYVALTRAEERVVLSVDAVGRQRPATPSRFLAECGLAPAEADAPTGLAAARTRPDAESLLRRRLRTGAATERAQAVYALDRLSRGTAPAWWSLIEPSAARPPALDGIPLRVAATGLADFRSCPHRFKCGQLLRLRRPRDPVSGVGIIVHAALSVFHEPRADHAFDETTLARLIDDHWDPEHFQYGPIEDRFRHDARGFVENYLRFHAQRGAALSVETPFEMEVGGLRVRGRIDAIFESGGSLEIVDYKTGTQVMSANEAASDLQLGVYGLAFDLSDDLRQYGSPTAATYLYVRGITPKSWTKGMRSRATGPDERARVREKIERYEAAIRRWELPAKSGAAARRDAEDADDQRALTNRGICRACEFRRICPDFAPRRLGA